MVLVFGLSIIITSCEKQDDLLDENNNPAMGVQERIKICHKTGNSYNVIEISESAWPGHESHGDILYEEFPRIGVYKWAIDFGNGDSTQMHTMYVTAVTETSFEGYGKDHSDDREWTIDDAVINPDDSWEFTIDYNNSGDELECSGSYICGEGQVGTFGGDESGSLSGFFSGGFPDENPLEEIDP